MAGNGFDQASSPREVFAQMPEIGSLLAGCAITPSEPVRVPWHRPEPLKRGGSRATLGQADLDQHRPWHAGQRLADIGQHLGQKGQGLPGDQLEGGDAALAMRPSASDKASAPPRGRAPATWRRRYSAAAPPDAGWRR